MNVRKPLRRPAVSLFHFSEGQRIEGPHKRLWGDCTGLTGDLSEIPVEHKPCDISEWVQ